MNYFSQRIPTVYLGLPLSFALLLVLGWAASILLLEREARELGEAVLTHFYKNMVKLERLTQETFTDEVYQALNRKPLALVDLEAIPELKRFQKKAAKIFLAPEVDVFFHTRCDHRQSELCFDDFNAPIEQTLRKGYQPESREWYLATESHHDWVASYFVIRTYTRRLDYPPVWGVVLTKRFLKSENEKLGLQESRKTRRQNEGNIAFREGVWVTVSISVESVLNDLAKTVARIKHFPFLSYGLTQSFLKLDEFSYFLTNLRLEEEQLLSKVPPEISCRAVIDEPGLVYKATVACQLNGEAVQFSLTKPYQRLWWLVVLAVILMGAMVAIYRGLLAIAMMQRRSIRRTMDLEKGRLMVETGARLVHDLKKGILTQLNYLDQDYGEDFDYEYRQADFKERLRKRLQHHFRYLRLLNKYIGLLNNNLKRYREKNWVPLDETKLRELVLWMTGEVQVESTWVQQSPHFLELILEKSVQTQQIEARLIFLKETDPLVIPEMAFFRILKNLWDNFNSYSRGQFRVRFWREGQIVKIQTKNLVVDQKKNESPGTSQIGLLIIENLIHDNFGPNSSVESQIQDQSFTLTITLALPEDL